jgi:hypothetical protein
MYEDRVLAFIDILGFSGAINRTIEKGMENENEIKRIDDILNGARELSDKYSPLGNDNLRADGIVHHFSDSIIISYPKEKSGGIFFIILEILFFSLVALQKGFLLRGAIVCDKLYHTETKIFGPAMVKAYQMERELAVYPRIILDNNILDIAKKYPREMNHQKKEFKLIKNILLTDFDGYSFINYLDISPPNILSPDMIPEYFESLRVIMQKIAQEKDPGIKSKYLWLKGKFNNALSKYKRRYSKDKTKEEYPELYTYIENISKDS